MTSHEIALKGFNVITFDAQGRRLQLNPTLIPCKECATGESSSYSFIVPKHKSGRRLYVEMLSSNGGAHLFGPAVKEVSRGHGAIT